MAKVGAQRAAELTGRSKSTIQRAMNNGKISYEVDANGRRVLDVSEIERAFGLAPADSQTHSSVEEEMEKVSTMLEFERTKMRIKFLEEQIELANTQIADLKDQRDLWQKQASQVLITSQYSQKQAEDLREELKERERKMQEARMKRQKQIDQQMKRLKAGNENADEAATQDENFNFKTLWKRVKGT
ncbi:MAG: entry exclusion 1 domain-containing protein [Alphaproteobacteria bacterium]